MEVSIPLQKVNTQYIFFAEKRNNIIVDGDFVKIMYSTESFEMNGLYILVELDTAVSSQQWNVRQSITPELEEVSDYPVKQMRIASPAYNEYAGSLRLRSGIVRTPERGTSVGVRGITGDGLPSNVITAHYVVPEGRTRPPESVGFSKRSVGETIEDIRRDNAHNFTGRIQQTKHAIMMNPVSIENQTTIKTLCQIEQDIVKRYIASYCPSKTATYILRTQLMGSTIKYHSENVMIRRQSPAKQVYNDYSCNTTNSVEKFILKISGLWETATNVGITMKFILLR